MKAAIINKINKIRRQRTNKDVCERPSLQLPLPEPRPRKKEESREAPTSRVIIIDLN